MATVRRNEPLASWQEGDLVEGFALLARKEVRQDRGGRSYLDLEIGDASGSLVAKAWPDSPAFLASFAARSFIAFKGVVRRHREQLQLIVEECREATEADRGAGFDETLLVPTTREDVAALWARAEHLFAEAVARPQLRRLARETLDAHAEALRAHPAARAMHHAYRGGLLEHVVAMAELALALARQYPEIDRDLLLLGVLFHDLGKLLELTPTPPSEYTLSGRLIGHITLGRDLLRERCAAIPDFPADLQLQLEHLVLAHQGRREFGSPVEPSTAEAVALHFLDDLDSKLNQFRLARVGAQAGQQVLWHRGLGRWVYLGPPPPQA
jgi:3'-5' exoribonuclease